MYISKKNFLSPQIPRYMFYYFCVNFMYVYLNTNIEKKIKMLIC